MALSGEVAIPGRFFLKNVCPFNPLACSAHCRSGATSRRASVARPLPAAASTARAAAVHSAAVALPLPNNRVGLTALALIPERPKRTLPLRIDP